MATIERPSSAFLTVATFVGFSLYILGCTPPKPEQQEPAANNDQAAPEPDQAQADTGTTGKYSPVKARARDFYAPNTEDLGPDEMRLIACGTGMPNNYLDKVFLSHLHTDHFGDLDALFVGGALAGRQRPLRVWGPSGETPERGTKYALEHLRKALTWDLDGRQGLTDPRGYHFDVTEFDYMGVNAIVYQENGVTIRSIPAIHSLDGPVSFIVEWNGFKFVFGGDTYPNKWYAKYATGADLAIHECFVAVPDMIEKFKFTPQGALAVGTQIHTAPEAFGKVMSIIKPRMAVAYHFFKDFDTTGPISDRIRTTYDGPLSLSIDYMVWNITKDDIRVRMAIVDEDVWPPPATDKPQLPDPAARIPYSDAISSGRLDMKKVIQPTYDEINKQYGLNEKQE
ncbi:MAG: hypothetical protein JRE73_16560 [Deltaproteobacteria bacterium]|nr:hypothetical protein [Deltaproteobacteria bacterium]